VAAECATRIPSRLLDLPDIGAKVGELGRAERALLEAGEVENSDVIERSGHSHDPVLSA
jgi:hypothetical protein